MVNDIEDDIVFTTPSTRKELVVKMKKRLRDLHEPFSGDSIVPGTQIVYLRTWGCTHNTSDSEYMAGLLDAAGYTVTSKKEDAHLWILNSCTVKTPSETQLENAISEANAMQKYVVVAGCVSQAEPNAKFLKNISLVGVRQIECIVQAVNETLNGNCVRFMSLKKPKSNLALPKIRKNNFIEIMPISSGCLNHCTYCKTKSARGDLLSYPMDDLIERAKNGFTEGCRELWLTSEDLGAWGRDIGLALPDLLDALVQIIPDDCMMRLGMTNPPYILDFLEEIARILNHPRVYSFLHIPVQSGSDAVLLDMKREYSVAHFCQVVDYMIKNVPNVYIATDLICAFPTETLEDFGETVDLVKKYKFPSLFINQFYPRKGTPAAQMKKIDTVEAKRRTAEISALFRSYSRYGEDRINEIHEVWINEVATDGIHYVGHNKCYEHFLIESSKNLLGKHLKVRVTNTSKFYMKASVQLDDCFTNLLPISHLTLLLKTHFLALVTALSLLGFWLFVL